MTHPPLDGQEILDMARAFMPSCLLGAAAELDLFTLLGARSLSVVQLVAELSADRRALGILLDALVAIRVLDKQDEKYSVPPELRPVLVESSPRTVLPAIRHLSNVMRGWSQLARIVLDGVPPPRSASIRGEAADRAAFVAAMHSFSVPVADDLVARLDPPEFTHFLDVGGASGTWTMAFLRAVPTAKATLFDLPDAIEQARNRLDKSEFSDRVELVAGDFYVDDLPEGADYAWLGAIAHQHSREHNRRLYAKVHAALVPGGWIAIRDVVMSPSRTEPPAGALFAVNMLANTETGDTFTFEEFAEDLEAVGFVSAEPAISSDDMNSVVVAKKPE